MKSNAPPAVRPGERLLFRAFDGAAAQHLVSVVQHHGLPGGDSPLGLVEHHPHAAALQRIGGAGRVHMLAVPGLGGAAHRRRRRGPGDPVDPGGRQRVGEQVGVVSQQDGVVRAVLPHHIDVLSGGDAQSLPLAAGVAGQPLVAAQHMAVLIHKVPRRQGRAVLLQEPDVVAVGDEADVLAVGLVRHRQPRLPRLLPDGVLVELPHRQQQMGQLELGELIEHIALVLPSVAAPQQPPAARRLVVVHTGIVPRGQIVVAQLQRPVQQRAELQLPVAVDAGVGRPARAVFIHEFLHDAAGEPLRFVQQMELHAQPLCHGTGILGVPGRKAVHLRITVQAEHGPAAGIALRLQQRGGGGAVHPAGHGDQYALVVHHAPHKQKSRNCV